jgi:hypothetical protein
MSVPEVVIDAPAPVVLEVSAVGTPGPGVPAGGTTGQVLAKASNADRDTEWVTGGGGGGGGGAVDSVNGQTGVVVLAAADVGAAADNDSRLSDARTPTSHGNEAHTSTFITAADIPAAPVASVNGATGVVVLGAGDVGADPAGSAAAVAGTLSTVATTGAYGDLSGTPTLGTLAAKDDIDVPGDIDATGTADATTFLRGDGVWATPVGGGGSLGECRSDFVDPYSYIGVAATGSAESDPVWTITRIDIGPPVTTTSALSVKWDDRLTETYS